MAFWGARLDGDVQGLLLADQLDVLALLALLALVLLVHARPHLQQIISSGLQQLTYDHKLPLLALIPQLHACFQLQELQGLDIVFRLCVRSHSGSGTAGACPALPARAI